MRTFEENEFDDSADELESMMIDNGILDHVSFDFDESNELEDTMIPILQTGQKRPNDDTQWISATQIDNTKAMGKILSYMY